MRLQPTHAWAAIILLGTMFHPKSVIGQLPKSERIPSAVEECEEGEQHTPLCSTWKWNGKEYDATWPDGSIGKLTINFIKSGMNLSSIQFFRMDQIGSHAGIVASYVYNLYDGKSRRHRVTRSDSSSVSVSNGQLIRMYQGVSKFESWRGTLIYGPVEDQRDWKSQPFNLPTGTRLPFSAPPPAQSDSSPLPPSSTNSGLNPQKINATLTELDSAARELSAQWTQFQKDCPDPTTDAVCLEDKRQVTLAMIENTKSRIQLIDQKISFLDAGPQDGAAQQAEDESAKKREELKAALRTFPGTLANLDKSLAVAKQAGENR